VSAVYATKPATANDLAEALMTLIDQELGGMSAACRDRLDTAIDALQTSAFGEGIDHERDRIVRSIRGLATGISLGVA